jgi:hypothetical protein
MHALFLHANNPAQFGHVANGVAREDGFRCAFVFARQFSLNDLHIYLAVPFVLSGSVFNAFACGAAVLASNTAPLCALTAAEENGLLADSFDVDECVRLGEQVLDQPEDFRNIGVDSQDLIRLRRKYSLEVYLPRLTNFCRCVDAHPTSSSISESRSNCARLTDNLTRTVRC